MKFKEFETLFRETPIISLATIKLMTAEEGPNLLNTLSRWCREGRIVYLRRGMYCLKHSSISLNQPPIANVIYEPSYLSLEWALSYYGLIPDAVFSCTSVTPRNRKKFTNVFGEYYYYHIKQEAFWGYHKRKIGQFQIWIADADKALLDYWHLTKGEWTVDRMEQMRFQQTDTINNSNLQTIAIRWNSPRLNRAVKAWIDYTHEIMKEVEI